MDPIEKENLDSEIEETETVDSPNDEPEVENETADNESEEEEYTEREKQLYARLKKLEKEKKELQEAKAKPAKKADVANTSNLSTADIIALTKADIDPEDIDEVVSYAKYKKISVTEALKSPAIKATLAENAEVRKSAQAVSLGGGRRAGNGGKSDERLLADAAKGILPETEADFNRLAELRLKNK